MRKKALRRGGRPIDFLKCRFVIFFVEAGLLKCCCFVEAGAALGIVDHARCRFAHLNLCAHFLNLRCLLVETLSELCNGRLKIFLLLRDRGLQLRDRGFSPSPTAKSNKESVTGK